MEYIALLRKRLENWIDVRKYRNINKKISPNDLMHKSSGEWYMDFGESALHCATKAMEKAGKSEARNILILPSGHGRELRFFKARFPEAQIVACDIDRDAVDFCAETFNVEGVYSHQDPKQIPNFANRFDLIWCGSLVTHLDEEDWSAFLQFFSESLLPNGILVFSTHGKFMIEQFSSGAYPLGIDENGKKEMFAQYDRSGFGYADYHEQKGYGISLSSKEWVENLISQVSGLQVFDYDERGWFYNHDVIACVKE